MPNANLMLDNQSLAIGVVKLNYTIRVFWSCIVLEAQKNCKGLSTPLRKELPYFLKDDKLLCSENRI